MQRDVGEGLFNIGSGEEVTIKELASIVTQEVGFQGKLVFDASKPDGTPRKVMDIGKMQALGWRSKIALRDGVRTTYADFLSGRARGI